VPGQSIRLRGVGTRFSHLHWDSDALLRVGRTPNLEIVLDDSSVSRRHAEVAYTDEGWVVRDLGSTNGTLVNGVRVGRTGKRLRGDEIVQVGDVQLIVTQLRDAAPQGSDAVFGNYHVTATTQASWEAAVDRQPTGPGSVTAPSESVRQWLRAQYEVYQATSLDELLGRCLADAVGQLKADYGAVVMMDRVSSRAALANTMATVPREASEQPFSHTLAQRCIDRGESLLCQEKSTRVGGLGPRSLVCALLRTPRQRLGVLHLERGRGAEPFSSADLGRADSLAAGMSAAVENMARIQEKQRNVYVQTVLALAQAVELRDPYTGGHAQRVTDYALMLADELKLSEQERNDLRLGAPLHDIGKIGIDDAILRKTGPLTEAEFQEMQTHTVKGVAILQPIPDLTSVLPLVRNHHERWDGKGYPDGLAGEAIPYLARVLAVADTFDAMTTDRPYREGLPLEEALVEIAQGAGVQFDSDCAAAFIRLAPRLEERLQDHALVQTSPTEEVGRERRLIPELARVASPSRVHPTVHA
jgi:HD-GYP domain-containing protein (c-di-GMP phosphodiesterase class II)/pSer/pThr/pTyr-binding forkhead associated (FHA) protein